MKSYVCLASQADTPRRSHSTVSFADGSVMIEGCLSCDYHFDTLRNLKVTDTGLKSWMMSIPNGYQNRLNER